MHDQFESFRSLSTRAARFACIAGLTAALAVGGTVGAVPSVAYAATAETMSELSRLQNEVQSASSTYTKASAKVDELNAQIKQMSDEILKLEQEDLPDQQGKASDAARNLYKMQKGSSSAISKLLTASSLSDFITMSKYMTTIQDDNVDALNDLNELEEQLNGKISELSAAKDEADSEQKKASEALEQAKGAAAQMQQKANAENAAEAEAARKAAEQAAALEAAQAQKEQQANTSSNTQEGPGLTESKPGNNVDTGSDTAAPSQPSQPSQPSGGNSSDQGSWMTGRASYYGIGDGFMGGTTASGAIVTETSMGVAMLNVPLGTMVEIRYGGNSVIAVVNDRGPYVHGRVIDMQPAVARALGAVSAGVVTVQYRFL